MRAIQVPIIAVSVCLLANIAYAHPKLLKSNPAANASLSVTPQSVHMSFSEVLVPRFTGLELKDAGGKVIPTGKAALDGDSKKLVVPVKAKLPPGTYTVSWHAVSTDTHRISGHYMFKVTR